MSASTNLHVLEAKTSDLGVPPDPSTGRSAYGSGFRRPPERRVLLRDGGVDSEDGKLFHVQTQHYPLTVPDVAPAEPRLDVRPAVEVEDL